MDKNLSNLLRSVNPDRPSSIMASFNRLKELTAADSDDEDTKAETQELGDFIEASLGLMEAQLDRLFQFIEYVEKKNHDNLPDLLSDIEQTIYDYKSATDAAYFYNKKWFSQLLLSDEDKQIVASRVVALMSLYTKDNQRFLQQILDLNPEVMEDIRYPILETEGQ